LDYTFISELEEEELLSFFFPTGVAFTSGVFFFSTFVAFTSGVFFLSTTGTLTLLLLEEPLEDSFFPILEATGILA